MNVHTYVHMYVFWNVFIHICIWIRFRACAGSHFSFADRSRMVCWRFHMDERYRFFFQRTVMWTAKRVWPAVREIGKSLQKPYKVLLCNEIYYGRYVLILQAQLILLQTPISLERNFTAQSTGAHKEFKKGGNDNYYTRNQALNVKFKFPLNKS